MATKTTKAVAASSTATLAALLLLTAAFFPGQPVNVSVYHVGERINLSSWYLQGIVITDARVHPIAFFSRDPYATVASINFSGFNNAWQLFDSTSDMKQTAIILDGNQFLCVGYSLDSQTITLGYPTLPGNGTFGNIPNYNFYDTPLPPPITHPYPSSPAP